MPAQQKTADSGDLLHDSEWLALTHCILNVNQERTHEGIRHRVMKALLALVPFDTAAFFLTDVTDGKLGGCLIVQPVGVDISAGEFERCFERAQAAYASEHAEGAEGAEGAAAGRPRVLRAEGAAAGRPQVLRAEGTAAGRPRMLRAENRAGEPAEQPARAGASQLDGAHLLICTLTCNAGPLGVLVLSRPADEDPFSARDEFILEVLEPHLALRLEEVCLDGGRHTLNINVLREEYRLTRRELEVMNCVAYGMTVPEISVKLTISKATAKKHLENIYRKVGVNNRMSLMKFAQQFIAEKHDDA